MSKKPKEHVDMAELGLQSFTMQKINRSELKGADYNPRVLDDKERAKLKAGLKRHGLVTPLTWNKRTGTLVGGHQRLSVLDSLAGSKDYELDVAVIDVDLAREKEINILLNNQQAAGSWDMELLKGMFTDEAVTIEGSGFDQSDMMNMFGHDVFNERSEDLQALCEKLTEIKDTYNKIRSFAGLTSGEPYLIFVFPTPKHVDAFIETRNLPNDRYQNGLDLMKALDVAEPSE
jgi:hypothetical protein